MGISAFGLGRLSIQNNFLKNSSQVINDTNNQIGSALKDNQNFDQNFYNEVIDRGEKKYVASKNGKMYYPVNCSGSNRIKPENKIWFATTSEAEKSGYQLSTYCK